MFGGVSPLGEYFITGHGTAIQQSKPIKECDNRIVFLPNDGPPVEIPVTGSSKCASDKIYWSMVNHNKALHGI